MSVTKRDFEAVADILNSRGPTVATINVTGDLAAYFASRNPRFDRKRFLAAAGVSEAHIAAAGSRGVAEAAAEATVSL
jgi:hypothetical protein